MAILQRWTIALLTATGAAGLTACFPLPEPPQPGSGAIGVILDKQWFEDGRTEISERIYFVRWNDGDDPAQQKEIVESNFHRGNRVYLLNAKPGRYSAVAAADFLTSKIGEGGIIEWAGADQPRRGNQFAIYAGNTSPLKIPPLPSFKASHRPVGQGPTISGSMGASFGSSMGGVRQGGDRVDDFRAFTTYFSEEMVRKSAVQVNAGDFVAMGSFRVLMHHGIRKGDKVQNHFYRIINASLSDPRGMPILDIHDTVSTRAQLVQDRLGRQAKWELLQQALDDFADTAWEPLVRRKLDSLR